MDWDNIDYEWSESATKNSEKKRSGDSSLNLLLKKIGDTSIIVGIIITMLVIWNICN